MPNLNDTILSLIALKRINDMPNRSKVLDDAIELLREQRRFLLALDTANNVNTYLSNEKNKIIARLDYEIRLHTPIPLANDSLPVENVISNHELGVLEGLKMARKIIIDDDEIENG